MVKDLFLTGYSCMTRRVLLFVLKLVVQTIRALARSRASLVLENLALQQQVAVLTRERPEPVLDGCHREVAPGL